MYGALLEKQSYLSPSNLNISLRRAQNTDLPMAWYVSVSEAYQVPSPGQETRDTG
jgi:hypothetical protein